MGQGKSRLGAEDEETAEERPVSVAESAPDVSSTGKKGHHHRKNHLWRRSKQGGYSLPGDKAGSTASLANAGGKTGAVLVSYNDKRQSEFRSHPPQRSQSLAFPGISRIGLLSPQRECPEGSPSIQDPFGQDEECDAQIPKPVISPSEDFTLEIGGNPHDQPLDVAQPPPPPPPPAATPTQCSNLDSDVRSGGVGGDSQQQEEEAPPPRAKLPCSNVDYEDESVSQTDSPSSSSSSSDEAIEKAADDALFGSSKDDDNDNDCVNREANMVLDNLATILDENLNSSSSSTEASPLPPLSHPQSPKFGKEVRLDFAEEEEEVVRRQAEKKEEEVVPEIAQTSGTRLAIRKLHDGGEEVVGCSSNNNGSFEETPLSAEVQALQANGEGASEKLAEVATSTSSASPSSPMSSSMEDEVSGSLESSENRVDSSSSFEDPMPLRSDDLGPIEKAFDFRNDPPSTPEVSSLVKPGVVSEAPKDFAESGDNRDLWPPHADHDEERADDDCDGESLRLRRRQQHEQQQQQRDEASSSLSLASKETTYREWEALVESSIDEPTTKAWSQSMPSSFSRQQHFYNNNSRLPPLGCSSDDLGTSDDDNKNNNQGNACYDSLEDLRSSGRSSARRALPPVPSDTAQRQRAMQILKGFMLESSPPHDSLEDLRSMYPGDGQDSPPSARDSSSNLLSGVGTMASMTSSSLHQLGPSSFSKRLLPSVPRSVEDAAHAHVDDLHQATSSSSGIDDSGFLSISRDNCRATTDSKPVISLIGSSALEENVKETVKDDDDDCGPRPRTGFWVGLEQTPVNRRHQKNNPGGRPGNAAIKKRHSEPIGPDDKKVLEFALNASKASSPFEAARNQFRKQESASSRSNFRQNESDFPHRKLAFCCAFCGLRGF